MLRPLAVVVLALGAAVLTAGAQANGDPASHVLVTEDVFLPLGGAGAVAPRALQNAVADAYRKGYRVKVAVIAARRDLGTDTKFFGSPNAYASHLGGELDSWYVGPLLVVMPNGVGVYDGGRSTAAERRVLSSLRVRGRRPSALAAAATATVRKLTAAGALRSKDVLAPLPYPLFEPVRPGRPTRVPFRILEDSQRAAATVTVYAESRKLAVRRMTLRHTRYEDLHAVTWTAPDPLPPGLRFCIVATDGSGNRSEPVCLPLRAATS